MDDFDRFWEIYPSRKGDRAKGPARVLFEKHIKSGIAPDTIIQAAEQFARMESEKIGTEFIMQAQRWLRNKRWLDFVSVTGQPTTSSSHTQVFVREGTDQWTAWQKHLKETKGRGSPCVNFGWWFASEWPPGITSSGGSNE